MQITKAPITHSDESFLFDLYADTRQEEMLLVNWDDEQKNAFLKQQFQTQHNYYHTKFPEADFLLILKDQEKAGRLYITKLQNEIRILDLTISPKKRGQGIGSQVIEEILRQANQKKISVKIYLETKSRAENLFSRLGFVPVSGDEVHQLWQFNSITEDSKTIKRCIDADQATA